MTLYGCDLCKFYNVNRSKYDRHLETKKHTGNLTGKLKVSQKGPKSKSKVSMTDEHICKYCGKIYKHKQSVNNHIKYNCEKNKDEDLKELVRLLNLQIQQKDDKIKTLSHQMEKQQKQIDKLVDKLQVTHITNNTTNNIQNNIKLLCYKDTDISHLTEKDYIGAIKKVTGCVKDMIEKIHFNPSKPENMNIYISNMKDKYLMVYEDDNWNIKNKVTEIDNLYETKEMLLEEWLDDEQHKYPDLRQKFERYLNNKENDETMNMIKEEIKLMLYNKKKLLE
jgi:ElaB/YqjD/DUF883 family membrane-anchored ribosome-binding protein/protein-arginine kinase activator protein McsA